MTVDSFLTVFLDLVVSGFRVGYGGRSGRVGLKGRGCD